MQRLFAAPRPVFDEFGFPLPVKVTRLQKFALWVGAALTLSPLALPVAETLSTASAQEETLRHGVNVVAAALGLASIRKISCVSPGVMRLLDAPTLHPARGRAFPEARLVWLEQSQCDALTGKPLDAKDFTTSFEQASADTKRKVSSLATLGHEAGHVGKNTKNEQQAECASFQLGPKIAVELGMDPAYADTLREYIIAQDVVEHQDPAFADYHFDLNQCRDGGPADLEPQLPGLFPVQE